MTDKSTYIQQKLEKEFPSEPPTPDPTKHYIADTNSVVRGYLHQRKEPLDTIKDWSIEIVTPHANFVWLEFQGQRLQQLHKTDGKYAVFGSALLDYRHRILRAQRVDDHRDLKSAIDQIYTAPSLNFRFKISYTGDQKRITHYRLWYGSDVYLDRKEDTGNWNTPDSFDHTIYRYWVTDNLQLTSFPGSNTQTELFPEPSK